MDDESPLPVPRHPRDLLRGAMRLPEEEREAWIRERCDGNSELESELWSLLRDHRNDAEPTDTRVEASLVESATRPSATKRGLQIRCPFCRNPIELSEDCEIDELLCDACGSSFSLIAGQETKSVAISSESVDRFSLIEKVGVGAFGSVYKAKDATLDRFVAVKVPRKAQLSDLETEKFLREARAAAQLRHPNIVAVHEVGRDADRLFIVADFVDGLSLADWLTGFRPTQLETVTILVKVAKALHYAHEEGVIHRDLKPSNIMLDHGNEPSIMDFGLAKREAGEITMTLDGQILGTPAYMSPEQARGESHQVDRRTDIYSLGVIMFEMLTGELPFRGNTRMLIHQVLTQEPPSPRSLESKIRRDLETICLKCLEKDPGRRYKTGLAFANDLERFQQGHPIEASAVGTLGRIWRWYTRNPRASIVTAAGYMLCFECILVGWAVIGVLFIGTGIHPMERPVEAMYELLGFSLLLYSPGIFGSIKVLNGKFIYTLLNLLVLVVAGIVVVAIFLNLNPPLEVLQAANDNVYARYQLSSLLATMVILGLILHGFALHGFRRLQSR